MMAVLPMTATTTQTRPHPMKITISHCQATVDPSATIPDSAFPAFLAALEQQYTAAIKAEYPDADVWFMNHEPAGNGVEIDGGDETGDIAWEIAAITGKVLENAFATA